MNQKQCLRLLGLETNPGSLAMALDEVLLEGAILGEASLRFYQWREPTVSLGYFQPYAAAAGLAGLPLVRRPTGGDLLVHHHELTYTLALPEKLLLVGAEELACQVHRLIGGMLGKLGASVACQPSKGRLFAPGAPEGVLCFLHPAAGDVLVGGYKVVGSAQRRRRGALLQHGSILLAASSHAPWLPGIRDLSLARPDAISLASLISDDLLVDLGLTGIPGAWTLEELRWARELELNRYQDANWTLRR